MRLQNALDLGAVKTCDNSQLRQFWTSLLSSCAGFLYLTASNYQHDVLRRFQFLLCQGRRKV